MFALLNKCIVYLDNSDIASILLWFLNAWVQICIHAWEYKFYIILRKGKMCYPKCQNSLLFQVLFFSSKGKGFFFVFVFILKPFEMLFANILCSSQMDFK